jgi:hypothetical protein
MNQQMRTPRVAQFSLGIGQQVTDEIGLNIDYVNSHGSNLYTPINVNYVNTAVTPSARVLTSKYGDINLWGSIAAAWNHAFLSTLAYNTPTMRWQLSYTLSWSFSQSDAITTARTSTALLAMQRSATDERHRVVLSGTYLLPWDFKVSAVATISSPLAFTVIDGRDLNKNNTTGDDWIDGVRTQFKPYNEVRWWYKMFDLRVSKSFNIANTKVELMVDAFNVFNWFNASGYSSTMNDQAGNKLVNFGLPNGTYAPRQVQAGLRVSY